jgi:hypothetical protein
MRDRPELDATELFLRGGQADKEVMRASIPAPAPKVAREQKMYRLPLTMTNAMRQLVFHHSTLQNRRVTETELVEIALQAFIDSQNR